MYTDKPMSLSVKSFLIRKMSTAQSIPEKTITSVIDHQFNSLVENMPFCNTLELSGFGKFTFNKKKGVNMMLKYIREKEELLTRMPTLEDAHALKRAGIRISQIEMSMKALNQKLQSYENQFRTDLGRMEESIDTSSRDEGADQNSGS